MTDDGRTTTTQGATTQGATSRGEQAEMVEMLAEQRRNMRITVQGIDDEQALRRTTVSELTLGGLVRHLAQCERLWTRIMLAQPVTPEEFFDTDQYRMRPDQTLSGLLADYTEAARITDAAIVSLPDLDRTVPLPPAPWFPETQYWSARRILLHVFQETAQHAGHADIIRESLDGASTTRQWAVDAGMEL